MSYTQNEKSSLVEEISLSIKEVVMTREEVLKAIRKYSAEMRAIVAALEYDVLSITQGYRLNGSDHIDSLKGMMDTLKDKADEVKAVLDQWPES